MLGKMNTKKAFTLAEVLITLGIIGVVAAMTLPTLMTNIEKKALETATKKFHATISNAISVYMADNSIFNLNASDLVSANDSEGRDEAQEAADDFIRKYFNVIKECDRHQQNKCFSDKYKSVEGGSTSTNGLTRGKAFVTNDGTALALDAGRSGYAPVLYVDVNGQNGPNVMGYDFWTMYIFKDGVVDEMGVTPEVRKEGLTYATREANFEGACKRGGYTGCFGHFLNNGYKFDY